jgi:hypothetical protein
MAETNEKYTEHFFDRIVRAKSVNRTARFRSGFFS